MKKCKKMPLAPVNNVTAVKCSTKKKKSLGKVLVKITVVVAAVNGAVKLYSMWKDKRNPETKQQPGVTEYDLMMKGEHPSFDGEYVKKITIKGKMSGFDMDLTGAQLAEDTYIYLNAFMSGICIRVPENVNVTTELKSIAAGVSNTVPKYLDDSLPLVHIVGRNIMSGVDIRVAMRDEDGEEA